VSATPVPGGFLASIKGLGRYSRLWIGASLLGFVVVASVFGPLIWTESPNAITGLPLEGRSAAHPLGTDELGRDELARLLYGGRVSLLVALVAVGIGLGGGTVIGLAAGHFGGRFDSVVMRVMDGLQAFPALLLAVMIAAALGPGLWKVMAAIGIAIIPEFARLARSQALRVRHLDYVVAGRLAGAHELSIVARHVLPNSVSAIIIFAATSSAQAILAEAGLAFIGLGAAPPTADWGAMLQSGYSYISLNPWLVIYPGAAIALTTLGCVFLGDGLRDKLDPRTTR
jgi:ABC-type dipeptide/oligopeptide/nickel transport system permease subunit